MIQLDGRAAPEPREARSRRWGAAMIAVLLAGWGAGSIGTAGAMPSGCPVLTVVTCPPAPPASTTSTTSAAPVTTAAPTTTTTTATATTSEVTTTEDEAATRLLDLLNAERAHSHLGPLAVRADVRAIATRWSTELADRGRLAHNDAYFTAETRRRLGARALGENVARAADPDRAHRALMDSPGHRANILDPRFTVIGVGAVLRDGSWWFTQNFVQPTGVAAAPPSAQPDGPRAAPRPAAEAAAVPSRPVVAADTATAVMAEGDPPTADATVVLDPRRAPTGAAAGDEVGTSPWTALAALLLTVPLFVLVGTARRRAVTRLRTDRASEDPASGEPDEAEHAPEIAHHLAVIDAWIKTLDDRWQVLSESDRLIAVQVIRRNAQAAVDAQAVAVLQPAHGRSAA